MAHHSSEPFGDNLPPSLRELMNQIPEAKSFGEMPPFGATGQFPQGKYHPSDEGEIQFGVAADKTAGKVLINFGKPTAWIGMDREQALGLAELLKQKADELVTIKAT